MNYLVIVNIYDAWDEITEQSRIIVPTEKEVIGILDQRFVTSFTVYTVADGLIVELPFQERLDAYKKKLQQEKWDAENLKKKEELNTKRKKYLSYLDFNTANTQSRMVLEIRARVDMIINNNISYENVKNTLPRYAKLIREIRAKNLSFDKWYTNNVMNYKFGTIDNLLGQ